MASLEETLATIVEGGEAKLKAEREAAAVSGSTRLLSDRFYLFCAV